MQPKRNGLVPIVFGGLDGPVKAMRDASPQAAHHFTRFDQVNQLVEAREAGVSELLSGEDPLPPCLV